MATNVIVVGGGVMGCAAAWAIARAGHQVRLFERDRIGSPFGSSHGPSRIIRLSYASPAYIPLCRRAYAAWRELEAEAATSLLATTGGLDFGAAATDSLERTCDAMRECGVEFERWNAVDIRRAYPQLRVADDSVAAFQADAGILAAGRCLKTLVQQAVRHGTVLHENQAVLSVRPDGQGVLVETSTQRLRADRLVLCPGSAIGRFLQQLHLSIPLIVSKEQVSYLSVRNPLDYSPEHFPICIRHFDTPGFCSIFPIFDAPGIKVMIEQKTPACDVHDFAVDVRNEEQVREHALALLEGFAGRILKSETCRYTLTSDENFIIDRHPAHPQIIVCSACSGHGFKFAAAIGQMIADLAIHSDRPQHYPMFSITRATLGGPSPQ